MHSWVARLNLRCDEKKRKDRREGTGHLGIRQEKKREGAFRQRNNVCGPTKKGCLREKSQDSREQAKAGGA